MKRIIAWLSFAGLTLTSAGIVCAETAYPLVNPSFEAPALSGGSPWFAGANSWGSSGSLGTTWETPGIQGSPAPNGDQFIYADSDGFDIWQQTGTLSANTRYRLLVDLYPLNTGTPRASVMMQETDTWSANFLEAHFQPTWQPARQDFALPANTWTTVELRFGSPTFPTLTGKNMRIHINGSRLAIDNVRLMVDNTAHNFHVSSSGGNNANDGFSQATPWSDFTKIAGYLPLMPGENVRLKAGDVFTQELNLRGKGTASSLVQVGRYGTGANPIIRRNSKVTDRALVWNNASYARISNIDAERAKLGVYFRYEWTDSGSQNITVENCNFKDMDDPGLDPANYNYEYAFSDAIFIGGQAWNTAEFATRVSNVTIRNITTTRCAHLFNTQWFYPGIYKSRVVNLVMEDCWAFDNLMGSFSLINVDGGWAKRVHAIGGGRVNTWSGSTLGMIQSSKNFLIEDCEFSYLDRAQSADGSGMDFEGNTENVTFQNNTVHNNDASAILILTTEGVNQNLIITNNTIYSNAQDPWNSEINSEIQGNTAGGTGVITNNGIYRSSPSINFLSPSSNWGGFTISGNRLLEFNTVQNRPTWWNFNITGNLEGWGGFNQWISNTVSSGNLWGQSTGVDPYAYSAPTWVNSTTKPYAWVRMSQTVGTAAEIFYITDADQAWNGTKRVSFTIIPDGTMREYFVDLGASVDTKGQITQVRLDPTTATGSNMAVDFVRLTDSTNPAQLPPPAPTIAPIKAVFTSTAVEDGEMLESARNSAVGGSNNSTATTFRLGDDASNRAYRQLLSFSTAALPDDAVITEATISMTRVGAVTGTIPIGVANSAWGDLLVDVANPTFGTSGLANNDWEAAATKSGASKFAWPAYLDGMSINSRLESADLGQINRTGRTQFRVRYQNDDDNDNTADNISYATGNHATGTRRPVLTVKYNTPTPWSTLIYDTFESGLGNYTSGGANAKLYGGSTFAWAGNSAANIEDDTGTLAAITSRTLDLHNPGFTQLRIDFRFYAQSFETGENFFVEYFNGTSWIIASNFVVGTNFTNNALNFGTVDILESSQVFPSNAQIRFRSDASDTTDDIYIDEVTIMAK